MEPKAKTISERFGFSDPELKTARHDEIMIWLDENLEGCMDHLVEDIDQEKVDHAEKVREAARKFWPQKDLGPLPAADKVRVIGKVWEFPVSDRQYVIGFVDMYAEVGIPCSWCVRDLWNDKGVWRFDGNVGKSDPKWSIRYRNQKVYFEVKPSIPSLGELMRQVNMYRKYQEGLFYVVSPDDRFRKMLESQKIGFIKYP